MYITIPAIPTPAGMTAPDASTGEAYIRRTDGTPKLKRSINFTSPSLGEGEVAPAVTGVQVTNPKYINDEIWDKLHVWVHNWFLQRIPEEHQHLVEDVKRGDVQDLLVKVFGLAARNPMEYCRTIKEKMKVLPPTIETFDLVAHQWVLDQFEMFDTIQDADCMGEYKMAPTDFVDHVIDTIEEHMPKFANTHRGAVMIGNTWTPNTPKERIKMMASRGALAVEKEVRTVQTAKRMRTDVTGYGVNDYSAHDYASDAYWEQWEVRRDGSPRYGSYGQYSSGYGGRKEARGDRKGAKGDHKGDKGDRKGGKGDRKGAKGDRKGDKDRVTFTVRESARDRDE